MCVTFSDERADYVDKRYYIIALCCVFHSGVFAFC